MPLKILHPENIVDSVNILLVGPPKQGKSTGAATSPGGILYFNLDTPNALRYARKTARDRIMEVDYSEGILPTMNHVVHAVYQDKRHVADTVVVDPLGHLHRRLLEELSNRAIQPTLPQYLATQTYIERFCRKLAEGPVNAIFVCHDTPVKDEATGEVERLPFTGTTNPALGLKLMEMVDVIGSVGLVLLEDGTKECRAQLAPGKGRKGGDRFDCLDTGAGWAPLNIAEWVAKIHADNPKKKETR